MRPHDRKLAKLRTTTSYELSDWHRGPNKGAAAERRVRSEKKIWRRAVRRHARVEIALAIEEAA